jgi:putative hydrolase of the HAD superfamily
MTKNKWVWVDLDDTLWDFRANSLVALAQVYDEKELGRYFSSCQQWIDSYHVVNDMLWAQYSTGEIVQDYLRMERFRRPLSEAGCADAEARRLSTEMDPLYLGILGTLKGTVDGAIELLEWLHSSGYKVGILSNGFKEVQYAKISTSGLDKHIDAVVLSDEIGINKPDVRIFEYAAQKVGSEAAESVMIGDNVMTDIGGAISAGWKAIWYNGTNRCVPEEIARNERVTVVTKLCQIKDSQKWR